MNWKQFCVSVKCTIGATNALIPTFTAIQYPTTMRTLSVGIGNFAAGLALITVPYLWLLVCNLFSIQGLTDLVHTFVSCRNVSLLVFCWDRKIENELYHFYEPKSRQSFDTTALSFHCAVSMNCLPLSLNFSNLWMFTFKELKAYESFIRWTVTSIVRLLIQLTQSY